MPLDADAAAIMQAMEGAGPLPWELSPVDARVAMEQANRPAEIEPVGAVEDRTIHAAGRDIPLRVYTPEGSGPWPGLVFFHGGGWVIGSIESHDAMARQLCNAAGCVVASVEYRLAPEHPFPAPVDDCFDATRWIAENAEELEIDARRLAVGGDSAGGNLAAVVAQRTRDEGGPPLVFQLLVYPVTDFDRDTGSMRRNAEGYFLTRDAMRWFDDHYLVNPADRDHPYAAPLRAKDFSRLAPALVITAEFDPLCDEGEAYGARLREAGVPATVSRYDGVFHGFFGMKGLIAKAETAQREAVAALRQAFGTA